MKNADSVTGQDGQPSVAVIILNWNGWPDTIECLESLQQLAYSNYQVIVVDNGSRDDSVEKIKDWCRGKIPVRSGFVEPDPHLKPIVYIEYDLAEAEFGGDPLKEASLNASPSKKRLILVRTGENLGFTGGNNVALRYCLKRSYAYFWLLNNDTVVEKNSLTEMIRMTESDGRLGVAGPMILFYDRPGTVFSAGISISKIGRRVKRIGIMKRSDVPSLNAPKDVEGIPGCALLIRQDTVRTIGLLDERYFLYMEEADWCTRAIRQHFRCVYVPRAKIWHKGWGSVQNDPGLLDYYLARSQILYLKKFSSGGRLVIDVFVFGIRGFLKVIRKSLSRRDFVFWRAHVLGLAHGLSGNYVYRWKGRTALGRGHPCAGPRP